MEHGLTQLLPGLRSNESCLSVLWDGAPGRNWITGNPGTKLVRLEGAEELACSWDENPISKRVFG